MMIIYSNLNIPRSTQTMKIRKNAENENEKEKRD